MSNVLILYHALHGCVIDLRKGHVARKVMGPKQPSRARLLSRMGDTSPVLEMPALRSL